MRRVGKDSTPSRDSSAGDPVKRRQSLSSAVSAFASELRSHTKKPGTVVLSRIASASPSKSTDDLSLANAARSKSCTHLPATNTASEGPLLTLVLAGTSFLDTTISESGERLYVIDTKGARTNISREDPVQGVAHVGAVSWLDDKAEDRPLVPRHRATIQMAHGRRYFVDEFLRRTKLTSSRLFNIPHYPHALKWKRSGGSFKLSVAKGRATIAVLELQGTTPRVKVFDALYEHDVTLREHRGVPVLLLDYLIATAILITCEKDEWLTAGSGPSTSGSSVHGVIHRWRMDVQPDPSPIPEQSGSTEEELESTSSTPEASPSSVLDIGPSRSGSHVEVSSDPGGDLSRRLSAPQSSPSGPGTRNSRLSTTSPQLSTFSRLPPLSQSTPTHPFSSEFGELVSDEDGASAAFNPLASVLPPTLGVSVGDSSPSRSPNASVFTVPPRRVGSPDMDSIVSIAGSGRYSHGRSLSIESPIGLETPRQASKSLPSSPMGRSTRRPATAGAVLGGSGGRRPFRPLPKPPVHAATLPRGFEGVLPVPPVPTLPHGVRDDGTYGVPGNARTIGSRFVSLSVATTSREEVNDPERVAKVSSTSNLSEGPRTIRRIASDVTLSAKAETELESRREDLDDRRESRCDNSSPLKEAVRRSIYKEPLPASSPSPTLSPSATSVSPAPSPIRTHPASSVSVVVPTTEPLRLRHPRPVPSDARYDALLRAPSTSSSSYTHSTLHGTRYAARSPEYEQHPLDGQGAKAGQHGLRPDAAGDSDREEFECGAPPAYDTIDFSHPPLRTPGFRGVR